MLDRVATQWSGSGVIRAFGGRSVENCSLQKQLSFLTEATSSSAGLCNCKTAGGDAVPSVRGDALIQRKELFACDMHNA